ncbi:MAG: hypothetical protein KC620_17590 [Myxococcales bacterium]|nr:hypothetical protein [Myxococcales bacterium]
MLASTEDVFFIGRRVLALLKDPKSDARRLARLIDHVPPLGEALVDAAEILYGGRGRVHDTAHAITLIGYRRVERVARSFLRAEYGRLREADAEAPPSHALVEPQMRYAAM